MTRELATLAQRLKHARLQRKMSQVELAAASEMRQPDISKIERGEIKETTGIARLSEALLVPASWLELGKGPEPDWNAPSEVVRAHPVSLQSVQTVPSTTWEQIKMAKRKEDLPAVFRLQMADNSMAPRAPAGAWVQFSTSETPRPGDGVLVVDRNGAPYFRLYRAGRPGCWEAHAASSAYAPLDSERDGLEVLAVLMAVEARWG